MRKVHIGTSKEYDMYIGSGLLAGCGAMIREVVNAKTLCLVSDDTVNALYGDAAEDALRRGGFAVERFVFPHGEASKCAKTYLALLDFLAQAHLTRTDALVALGGGVVGDLTGFAAATYLRGIRFVQMPTTVLAAMDSSVGGKTAIDIPAGKNLVGAFHQPEIVICDTDLLRSLPADIYRDGCAEVIKHGVILDADFFDRLEQTHVKDQEEEAIARSVEIKRDVVDKDEFERGLRSLLNFGHTIGHAIEASADFTLSHGACVALGMRIITRAAVAKNFCAASCLDRINAILDNYGFHEQNTFTAEQLAQVALSDKKCSGDSLTLVLPRAIGECFTHKIQTSELLDYIKAGL